MLPIGVWWQVLENGYLEAGERAAFAVDPSAKEREEEERVARQFYEEIPRIRAMHANKVVPTKPDFKKEKVGVGKESMGGGSGGLDKENVLKVSWEKVGEDYSGEKLRELFSKFGEVEDVIIKCSKKKGSARVVMATKEVAVAATGSITGHISNLLLVLPLQPEVAADFPVPRKLWNLIRLIIWLGLVIKLLRILF